MADKRHRIILRGVYIDDISKKFVKMSKRLKKRFSSMTKSMSAGFRSVGRAATSVFRSIRKAAKRAVFAVVAITAALTAAALSTARFTEGLLEIKTLGVTKSVGLLRDEVLSLTTAYGQESAETIKAYYDAISAGVKQSMVVAFLGDAAKAAIAGVTDLATATDGLTSVLNAYQLTADKASFVSDAFFGAIKAGKTTFTELAASVGMVAPLAAAAGVPLKELMAVIAGITKSGLKTENAITGVKAMLTQLIKPQAAALAAAKKLGIEWGASALQAKGLAGILQELAEKADGNIEVVSELFGNVRGLGPALSLMAGDAQILKGAMRDLEASTGAVDKAFAIMSKNNVALQWRQLKEEIKAVWVLFGATFIKQFSGVLGAITDGVKGIKDALTEMDLSGYFKEAGDAVRGFVNHIAKAITGKDELFKDKEPAKRLFSKFRDDVIAPERRRRRSRSSQAFRTGTEDIKKRQQEQRDKARDARLESQRKADAARKVRQAQGFQSSLASVEERNRRLEERKRTGRLARQRKREQEMKSPAKRVEKVVESGVNWLINTGIPKMQAGFDKVFAYLTDGRLKADWLKFHITVDTTLNLIKATFATLSSAVKMLDDAFRKYHENVLKSQIRASDPNRRGTLFEPNINDFSGPSLLSDPERWLQERGAWQKNFFGGQPAPNAIPSADDSMMPAQKKEITISLNINGGDDELAMRVKDDIERLARSGVFG